MSSQAVSLNLIVKNPDEEYRLIEKAIGGSKEAFKELFMKNVSKVHSLCLRISSDTFIADELTQVVFIKAWEGLTGFQFKSKFSSWLHSIAVNEFLMHLRTEKRHAAKVDEIETGSRTGAAAQMEDSRIDIEKAISKLPEQARTVLVLHDIEGYKHIEISGMMKIEPGTSKAHLNRARKILREELSK